jgi:hypothetical protein
MENGAQFSTKGTLVLCNYSYKVYFLNYSSQAF